MAKTKKRAPTARAEAQRSKRMVKHAMADAQKCPGDAEFNAKIRGAATQLIAALDNLGCDVAYAMVVHYPCGAHEVKATHEVLDFQYTARGDLQLVEQGHAWLGELNKCMATAEAQLRTGNIGRNGATAEPSTEALFIQSDKSGKPN